MESRVFAVVGTVFGAVFVAVNAGRLPALWTAIALAAGAVLLVIAIWRGVLSSVRTEETWTTSPRAYWLAVAAEVVAIPAGATVLNRVVDEPDLVVLWVVLVVGAHFLPARAFGVGRYAELGVVLMSLAIVFAVVQLVGDVDWAAPAGAVLAGCALIAFAAVPALSRPRTR